MIDLTVLAAFAGLGLVILACGLTAGYIGGRWDGTRQARSALSEKIAQLRQYNFLDGVDSGVYQHAWREALDAVEGKEPKA